MTPYQELSFNSSQLFHIMRQQVIFIKPHGQTSNNLFQHIHFLCYCNHKNLAFINPEYNEFYIGSKTPTFKKFISKILRLKLFRKALVKLNIASEYNFNNTNIEKKIEDFKNDKHKIIFVKGWYFREHTQTRLQQPTLSKQFKTLYLPDGHPIEKSLNPLFPIVGIHIRRGDYKQFLGGKYYFEDGVYLGYMAQIRRLLNQNTQIIIFTNDATIDISTFNVEGCEVFLSKGTVWQDYHLMHKCNYLIGPPSTFSMWASFIGAVPLFMIEHPKLEINDLTQFRVIEG